MTRELLYPVLENNGVMKTGQEVSTGLWILVSVGSLELAGTILIFPTQFPMVAVEPVELIVCA